MLLTAGIHAGEYNPVLDIGDQAPVWKELPGVDDKLHSLADLAAHEAVVLVFTCNSCPYAVDYEDRIIALTREFAARKVAVVAVNVNRVPEDSFEAMRVRAAAKQFNFPYLFDESQQIAHDYGATNTPEFFVLDRDRRIAYMGALDDSPDAANVTERHVAAALEANLNGTRPGTTETVSIGCRIRTESPGRGRKSRNRGDPG
jgi:peroxiredoxin